MGFNKRFISKDSLKIYANDNDYVSFFRYFKSDVLIFDDNFSLEIAKDISKRNINEKEEIINIMNKCK